MRKKLTKEYKELRAKYLKDLRRRILDSRVYVLRFPKEIKNKIRSIRKFLGYIESCEYYPASAKAAFNHAQD